MNEYHYKINGVTMLSPIRSLIFIVPLLFFSCNKTVTKVAEEPPHSYTNKTVGISFHLPKEWAIYTSQSDAPENIRNQLPERKNSSSNTTKSPLFMGVHDNQQLYARCLYEETAIPLTDYFDLLYSVNAQNIRVVSAKVAEKLHSIQWSYIISKGAFSFRFQETLTPAGNGVIRLGFWTLEPLYRKYEELFMKLTSSMQIRNIVNNDTTWVECWKTLPQNLSAENISYIQLIDPDSSLQEEKECMHSDNALLWEVKGVHNRVFLSGSIHMAKPSFYPLHQQIEDAFKQSKYLAVEINIISDETMQKTRQIMDSATLPDNKTIEDVISKPVYDHLYSAISGMGLPMDNFKYFAPWFLSLMLTSLKSQAMGFLPQYGVEQYFLERATSKKTILELESFDEQLRLLKTGLDGETYLAYTLFSLNTMEHLLKDLINAWQCGNVKKMESIVFKDYSLEFPTINDVYEKFFFQRNKKFADTIAEFLTMEEDYFVLVGAGHLIGEKSVINFLEKKGFEIISYCQ